MGKALLKHLLPYEKSKIGVRPKIGDIEMSVSLNIYQNSKARIILLIIMPKDVAMEFKVYEKIMDLWNSLENI